MFSISIQQLTYAFLNGADLFQNLSVRIPPQKIGLVGENGIGKSMLLKMIAGDIEGYSGTISPADRQVGRMSQNQQEFIGKTIAEVLGVADKLAALHRILEGTGKMTDFEVLDDDWEIEERVANLLRTAQVSHIQLDRQFETLSGGERSRLCFAVILYQQPDWMLLDEPTNHLDTKSREQFYQLVQESHHPMIVVSHDRTLLDQMDRILELSHSGLQMYGGNYTVYRLEKEKLAAAHQQAYQHASTELKKRRLAAQRTKEKQQKRSAQGAKAGIRSGLDKMTINTLRGEAEKTASKLKDKHAEKLGKSEEKVRQAKTRMAAYKQLKIDIAPGKVPAGKTLLQFAKVNHAFGEDDQLWSEELDFEMQGGERVVLSGDNGSGKSTVFRMIMGELHPQTGTVRVGSQAIAMLSQHHTGILDNLSILENMRKHAPSDVPEHALRTLLGRLLFYEESVHQLAVGLSGGERTRLALGCLLAACPAPDLLLMDEPTNHLDLESIAVLEAFLKGYAGGLIVISHDMEFVKQLGEKVRHLKLERGQ